MRKIQQCSSLAQSNVVESGPMCHDLVQDALFTSVNSAMPSFM